MFPPVVQKAPVPVCQMQNYHGLGTIIKLHQPPTIYWIRTALQFFCTVTGFTSRFIHEMNSQKLLRILVFTLCYSRPLLSMYLSGFYYPNAKQVLKSPFLCKMSIDHRTVANNRTLDKGGQGTNLCKLAMLTWLNESWLSFEIKIKREVYRIVKYNDTGTINHRPRF